MKINIINMEEADNSAPSLQEFREERAKLTRECIYWLNKIVKLNSLYSGKIRKISKRLEELENILK